MGGGGRGGGLLPPEGGISLEGGDAIVPFLPSVPVGCLVVLPDGMGVPPVRSGDVAFAQRDGVVQFGDYYEPRILTFQVSVDGDSRSEEHTSELQSLMRISYAVFCLKKKKKKKNTTNKHT